MNIKINGDETTIFASGVEFLKLKTQIGNRVGNLLTTGKGALQFPSSCLTLIRDLLDPDSLIDVVTTLNKFDEHEKAREQVHIIMQSLSSNHLPTKWLDILDPAQGTAVAAMTVPGMLGLCLFDEQGSGKTVMSIASFDILKELDIIDAVIIICPKSMVNEWPKDIDKFTQGKFKIVLAAGNRSNKYNSSLQQFEVLITNYEGIDTMLTSLVASAQNKRYLLIVDESYYIKNSNSIRSENIIKLRSYCTRCFVLCGTPAPNSAQDLINQFNLADLNFTFAGFNKSTRKEDDFSRIEDRIETRGLFIRRLKSEILSHVPEKNFHLLRVKLTGRQQLMYENARHDLELELKTLNNESFKKKLATYFQRRAVLLQICCCPESIDPTFSETGAKYLILDELINRLASEKRKLVIWSFYKRSLDQIEERYHQYGLVRVDGSVSSAERQIAVKSFQENPETMLFLGNPAAAGAGITLHAAYDAVYISYSNQAAHYLQSLDRIHRRGQISNDVNYYLIICSNTIEETEVIRLRKKEINQANLLGDHIPWPTSLDDALLELYDHE